MRFIFDKLVKTSLFRVLLFWVVNLYSVTFRIKLVNEEEWLIHVRRGEKVLLCAWHQQFFAAIRPFRKYRKFNPSLMISKSSDGDIVAGVANKCGWHVARGSSSRGGKEALRSMIEQLKRSGLAAHIVDGPKGPAGKVKAGVIQLAHAADALIVPFYTYADRAWYFNSWDKFMLPKPFSKVIISFGEVIKLMPAKDQNIFESQKRYLEGIMLPCLRAEPNPN
jgi:hypothetical protein